VPCVKVTCGQVGRGGLCIVCGVKWNCLRSVSLPPVAVECALPILIKMSQFEQQAKVMFFPKLSSSAAETVELL